MQEIRELHDEVQQYRDEADALRRELRRSREEVTERANVVATLQTATELYSQELTAAKFPQKLGPNGQQPEEALATELQRCQEELPQQITLVRTYREQRDLLQRGWGNWQPEEGQSELQAPGDADSAYGAVRSENSLQHMGPTAVPVRPSTREDIHGPSQGLPTYGGATPTRIWAVRQLADTLPLRLCRRTPYRVPQLFPRRWWLHHRQVHGIERQRRCSPSLKNCRA